MTSIHAKTRLDEIVNAIRDLRIAPSMAQWREEYLELFELSQKFPLSIETAEQPITRMIENLQAELQLRTSEFLVAAHNEFEQKETEITKT